MGFSLRLFAPHVCGRKSSRKHPVRGELHIQRRANQEVGRKGTRIKQKWLFIGQNT